MRQNKLNVKAIKCNVANALKNTVKNPMKASSTVDNFDRDSKKILDKFE